MGGSSAFVEDVGSVASYCDPDGACQLQAGSLVSFANTTFKVLQALGDPSHPGGFGDVYLVEEMDRKDDSPLPARLAMKVPKASASGSATLQDKESKTLSSFLIEAAVATGIQALTQELEKWKGNVFIPSVFAVGEAQLNGSDTLRPVLLMEEASGTLYQACQVQCISGEAFQCIAWALASTLAHLNEEGCVHGDLKPSNILWRQSAEQTSNKGSGRIPSGWPLLADFGSSQDPQTWVPRRTLHKDTDVCTTCWTPKYAAPEVHAAVENERKILQTAQSDMFAWAKTLQEVIKLQSPLSGSLGPLEQILSKCLSILPRDRPESFKVIARQLETPACKAWAQSCQEEQLLAPFPPAAVLRHSLEHHIQAVQLLQDKQDAASALRTLRFLAGQRMLLGEDATGIRSILEQVLQQQLTGNDGNLLDVVETYIELGSACCHSRDWVGSLRYYETASDILQLSEWSGRHQGSEALFAVSLVGLANQYIMLAQSSKDPSLFEKSIDMCHTALQIHPRDPGEESVAVTKVVIGQAYLHSGRPMQSLKFFIEAREVLQRARGRSSPEVAKVLFNLAEANLELDDPESMCLFREALEMEGDFYGDDNAEITDTMVGLGRAGYRFGVLQQNATYIQSSLELFKEAHEIRLAAYGPHHEDVTEVKGWLDKAQEAAAELTPARTAALSGGSAGSAGGGEGHTLLQSNGAGRPVEHHLQVGMTVTFQGLKKRPALNGASGLLCGWDANTQRWKVEIPGDKVPILVKAENLRGG